MSLDEDILDEGPLDEGPLDEGEDSFVVPDDDDFLDLSDWEEAEGDERNVFQQEQLEVNREFSRYMIPFLQILDKLCSEFPFFINYMCVIIDDQCGTARGLKRFIYCCNSGNAQYVSNLMLAYRIILLKDQCRIDRVSYAGLLKCFVDDNKHQGHAPQGQNTVNQRLRQLDTVLAFLDTCEGVIKYDYPEQITRIAAACHITLEENPDPLNLEERPMLPYFIFYEFCQKEGNSVRNKRECAGFSSHADFPALRLLRLLWRNRGCVPESRQMYENECENVQQDPTYQLLSLQN